MDKLVAFFISGNITAEEVAGMTSEQWALAEKGAGTRKASPTTRALVLQRLVLRAKAQGRMPADPFAGF